MERYTQELQTIFNAIGILTANFTAATTDIITDTAHGLKTGDKIVLTTSDTLPAGLALATVYYVEKIDANTFYVSTNNGGVHVDITDTGTGTHTWTMHDIGDSIRTTEYRNIILALDTASSANLTIKFQGSISDEVPDFSAAQTATNQWDYIEVKDLEDGSAIDGDAGIAPAGADDHRLFEMNTNGLSWINAIISGWSAGNATLKVKLFNNG